MHLTETKNYAVISLQVVPFARLYKSIGRFSEQSQESYHQHTSLIQNSLYYTCLEMYTVRFLFDVFCGAPLIKFHYTIGDGGMMKRLYNYYKGLHDPKELFEAIHRKRSNPYQ